MADRMSAISRHLRNFARRPQEKLGPVPLLSVIDDATALMSTRLNGDGARIRFDRPEAALKALQGAGINVLASSEILALLGEAAR